MQTCSNQKYNNAHIPNIHALNSDTHTLFLSILILNSQNVGVAIEGIDIWYMVVTLFSTTEDGQDGNPIQIPNLT